MSEKPPFPPEVPDAQPTSSPSTPETQPSIEYVEIEIPEAHVSSPIPKDSPERGQPQRSGGCLGGCLWALGGMFACSALLVVLGVGAALSAGKSVTNALNETMTIFQIEFAGFGNAPIRFADDIYIPEVERIQALANITTTRFNYADIIASQAQMPAALEALYGESLVMVAVGHIEAGIDLRGFSRENITVDREQNRITVTLPAPQITNCFLDVGDSYVVQRSTGVFARPAPDLDDRSQEYALAQFRQEALEDGLLTEAATEAQVVLSNFLQTLSGVEVTVEIIFEPADPDAPLPDSCT